jgi:hypothetical protein
MLFQKCIITFGPSLDYLDNLHGNVSSVEVVQYPLLTNPRAVTTLQNIISYLQHADKCVLFAKNCQYPLKILPEGCQ